MSAGQGAALDGLRRLSDQYRWDPFCGVLPTFGVWCHHERRWVALGRYSLKEAWWALLDLLEDCPHPWELSIQRLDAREVGTLSP